MKYYIILILGTLIISCKSSELQLASLSQKPINQTNLIVIETTDKPDQCLRNMLSIFRGHGFEFLVRETSPPRLITGIKKFEDIAVKFEANIFRTDSSTVIKLKGMAKNIAHNRGIKGSKFDRIEFINEPQDLSWEVMDRIASSYSNGNTWYVRES